MAEELWTKTPVLRVRVDESMVAEMYGGLRRQIHGGDGVWRTAVTNPWRRRHTENAHDGSGSGVWRTVAADPWRPRLSPEATNESATKQREKWSRGRGQQLDAGDRVAGWRLRPAALGERRRRQGLRGEAEGEVEQGGVGRRKSGDG
jgi:hypothetical protein